MSASGYTRIPTDTDSDGVPDQLQETSQTLVAPVQPPPENSSGPSPALVVTPATIHSQGESVQGHGNYPVPTFQSAFSQPTQQQQQSNNVNVVMTQPQASVPAASSPKQVPLPNPLLMIITIIAAMFLFFLGAFPVWFCIFPAVIFAVLGYNLGDSPKEDQRKTSKLMNSIAMGCNVAALVTFVLMMVLFIILTIVFAVKYEEYHRNRYHNHDYVY